MMNLLDKLNSINKPALKGYAPGQAKTVKDFYTDFIEPRLPDVPTVLAMHEQLLRYVADENLSHAIFPIRIFNEKNEARIRRGFFTKTDELAFFYTDNSFAYFFAKMAFDNECPANLCAEMADMMGNYKFPYKYIIRGSLDSEKQYAAFPAWKKNPSITSNYKLAHIFDAGGDKGCEYAYEGTKYSVGQICELIFLRGEHSDWVYEPKLKKYIRKLVIKPEYQDLAKKFLVAHFLRFVDPLNYFLSPKANYKGRVYNHFQPYDGKKDKDIGEYKPLRFYVSQQFMARYPKVYEDYLERIMLPKDCLADTKDKIDLDIQLEYDPGCLPQYSTATPRAKSGSPKQPSGAHRGRNIPYKGLSLSCRDYVLAAIKDYIANYRVHDLNDLLVKFPSIATPVSQVKNEKKWHKEVIQLPSGEQIRITNQVGYSEKLGNRDIDSLQKRFEALGIR